MSNTKDIPPGAYRLSRDVRNPRPDRRHSRDWRKDPVWKAGTEFVVREQQRFGGKQLDEVVRDLDPSAALSIRADNVYTVVELAGDRYPSLHRIGPGDSEQYAALEAALASNAETLAQFMTRIDCDSKFTEWLVEHGHVLRENLELWWRRYQYGDEIADQPSVISLPVPPGEDD